MMMNPYVRRCGRFSKITKSMRLVIMRLHWKLQKSSPLVVVLDLGLLQNPVGRRRSKSKDILSFDPGLR